SSPAASDLIPLPTRRSSDLAHHHAALRAVGAVCRVAAAQIPIPLHLPSNGWEVWQSPDCLRSHCGITHGHAQVIVAHRLLPCWRSEEHTSELQSRFDLVCRL